MPVRDLPVRVREGGEGRERLAIEAAAIRAVLPDPVWLVALDRRGRQAPSVALAESLRERLDTWPHPIAWVVGSDLGLDATLVAGARERLSLSALTLPHQLARLVLYEQLYRALSLDAGIKYHRAPL